MDYKAKISKRQESNRELVKIISELVEQYPDQRFGQIISNYIFPEYRSRDIFFDESVDTLNKLKNSMTMKLGKETGSITNWMMAANNTKPVAGEDMTVLMWTDRVSYKVLEVIDEKHLWVAEYEDCYDECEPLGTKLRHTQHMKFTHGAWRIAEYDYENKLKYKKVNVIFGVRNGYRDPNF